MEESFFLHRQGHLVLAELEQARIWGLAHELRERLRGKSRVLLLSEQRDLVAAACLAAFAGEFQLVLPQGLSEAALGQLPKDLDLGIAAQGETPNAPAGMDCLALDLSDAPAAGAPPEIAQSKRMGVTLFTGGSTGRPRAWSKSAGQMLGEARLQARLQQVGPDDHLVSCVGPLHIYGLLWSVLMPLLAGARVQPATAFLPSELLRACPPANLLLAAPAHYRAIVKNKLKLGGLRLAISSAGMLAEDDSRGFSALSGAPVCEIYGSTETGGLATRWRARNEQDWTLLPATRMDIEAGRLAVDSPFLSPELERNPAGLFVTGDRACRTEASRFELLGRADGVVKVGGKRLDLAELEEFLSGLAGLDEAWVLSMPSSDAHEHQIVAVLAGPEPLEQEGLRRDLSARFEPLLQPRRFVFVERIPLTSAGKRDRRAIEQMLRRER